MCDYKELVNELLDGDAGEICGAYDILGRAADAIEELIMQNRGTEEAVKVMQMEIDRLLASRTPKEDT